MHSRARSARDAKLGRRFHALAAAKMASLRDTAQLDADAYRPPMRHRSLTPHDGATSMAPRASRGPRRHFCAAGAGIHLSYFRHYIAFSHWPSRQIFRRSFSRAGRFRRHHTPEEDISRRRCRLAGQCLYFARRPFLLAERHFTRASATAISNRCALMILPPRTRHRRFNYRAMPASRPAAPFGGRHSAAGARRLRRQPRQHRQAARRAREAAVCPRAATTFDAHYH